MGDLKNALVFVIDYILKMLGTNTNEILFVGFIILGLIITLILFLRHFKKLSEYPPKE